MKTRKFLFIICLILFNFIIFLGTCRSEKIKSMMFNYTNTGLPDNDIRDIAFDKDNVKWFATGNGLCKFDGELWVVYNQNNSGLRSNDIRAIHIDTDNKKWIGTSNGLAVFDDEKWQVYYKDNSGLPNNVIQAIASDKEGNIWLGTEEGLVKYNGKDWIIYNSTNTPMEVSDITTINMQDNGVLWLGSYGGGLIKYDGSDWTVFDEKNSKIPDLYIKSIVSGKNGNLWINTMDGLLNINDTTWTVYKSLDSNFKADWFNDAVIDINGDIWAVTALGSLARFNGNNWTIFNTSNSILQNYPLWSIAIDKKGTLWVGTIGAGVVNIKDTVWSVYNIYNTGLPQDFYIPYGLGYTSIDDIVFDNDRFAFIAVRQSCIVKTDLRFWKIFNLQSKRYNPYSIDLDLNSVWSMAVDRNNNLWASDYGLASVAKYNDSTWTIYDKTNSNFNAGTIRALYVDRDNTLWICAYDGGLLKYDGIEFTQYNDKNGKLPSNKAYSIAEDKKGNKWIGTSNGLVKYDGNNWNVFNTSNSVLPGNEILELAVDSLDNVWVAFQKAKYVTLDKKVGLVKIKGDEWTVYTPPIEIYYIWRIVIDKNNNLWLGTCGSGLYKFDGINWTYIKFWPDLDTNWSKIYSLAIDKYSNKWIGLDGGYALYIYNENGIRLDAFPEDVPEQITTQQQTDLEILPNPASYYTQITYKVPRAQRVTIFISDYTGTNRKFLMKDKLHEIGQYSIEYDAKELVQGFYYIIIQNDEGIIAKKLIILR